MYNYLDLSFREFLCCIDNHLMFRLQFIIEFKLCEWEKIMHFHKYEYLIYGVFHIINGNMIKIK